MCDRNALAWVPVDWHRRETVLYSQRNVRRRSDQERVDVGLAALGRKILEREDTVLVVPLQVLLTAGGSKGQTWAGSIDPAARVCAKVCAATYPLVAVSAKDIGRHPVSIHSRASENFKICTGIIMRLVLSSSKTRRNCDIATAISVHDKDLCASHLVAQAQGDP